MSTLESIFCFIKTNILSFISHGHQPLQIILQFIGVPLFIVISRHGVVSYTDDNKAGLHYYRQTPVQGKVYTMSCGMTKKTKYLILKWKLKMQNGNQLQDYH